mmetsp:Transcript_12455/g.29852  ORF Transcript_12455/g.29852 Transcript_12455/m.29852 type:complete len:111 (+) Transcript_12455:80-412(+)|eukprot:1197324-Rhodomonas_salina.2
MSRCSAQFQTILLALLLSVVSALIPPSVIQSGSHAAVYQSAPLLKATSNHIAHSAVFNKGKEAIGRAQEYFRKGFKPAEHRGDFVEHHVAERPITLRSPTFAMVETFPFV